MSCSLTSSSHETLTGKLALASVALVNDTSKPASEALRFCSPWFALVFQDAGKLFEGSTSKQDKSQDDISEEPAVFSDSMHSGATALDWSMISSDSGTEGILPQCYLFPVICFIK